MMNSDLQEALLDGVEHVFCQFGDLLALSGGDVSIGPDECFCSYMDITGCEETRLLLGATQGLCRKVLSIMFPQEELSRDMEQDIICELLNMIAETTRTLLGQRGLEMSVGVPYPHLGVVPTDVDEKTGVSVSPLGERLVLWTASADGE
jgi:hypothetical protein